MRYITIYILLHISWVSYSQIDQDSRNHSNVGLAYAFNPKYRLSNLKYYYKSPLIIKRFHVHLDVEAYQLSSQSPIFLLGMYNKFNLIADYNIPISNKMTIFPFVGMQIIADLSNIKVDPNMDDRFGIAPVFGINTLGFWDKWVLRGELRLTPYLDGWWIEIKPQIAYDIWKGVCLHLGLNVATGFTYQGKADIGFYPYIGVNYFIPLPEKKEN